MGIEQFLQQIAAARRLEYLVALAYESLNNEIQRMWRSLAIFPETFDKAAAAAVWEVTSDSAQGALDLLMGYGLIEVDEVTRNSKRYRVNKTLRLFADARLAKAERERAQRRHAEHYKDILATAERLYREGFEAVRKGLDLFDAERTNIEAGLKWAGARANRDDSDARLYVRYFDASFYVLDLRQHPHDRIRWLQVALKTARQLKWRKSEFDLLGSLGNAYRYLSETQKAIDYFEQALKIRPEIGNGQGGEFIGEGFVLGRLGLAYDELGEAEKAFDCYEKALQVDRERDDQAGKVITLSDRGYAEFNRGNTREAIKLYEQALDVSRAWGIRRGEGITLSRLGLAYDELGNRPQAIECYEQSLRIRREIGDRRGEGIDLGRLGLAYFNSGETSKAIEFYEQALPVRREIGDRRGEGVDLGNLGNAYLKLGEVRIAIDFFERALQINREIGDRRGEGIDLFNLGLAHKGLGETDKAIEMMQAALEILEQVESPHTGKIRRLLDEMLAEQRE
jgi:tetratricopeptide (TPR) repeat protein